MSNHIPDHHERQRINQMLGRRTVVVAGAGSGKTHHLVQRVSAELGSGLDPRNVAVITFTERAARELLHRLRGQVASASIDEAYIGTIHGFCLRILRRYPIEAGLPPVFHAMGEISSQTSTADEARVAMHQILNQAQVDPQLMEAVRYLVAENKLDSIATLVIQIANQWDRFSNVDTSPLSDADYRHFVDLVLDEVHDIVNHPWVSDPTNTDRLAMNIGDLVVPWLQALPSDWTDPVQIPSVKLVNAGSAKQWVPEVGYTPKEARHRVHQAVGQITRILPDIYLRRILVPAIDHALTAARSRVGRGELNFDDLLVLTRRLLDTNPAVRDEVRSQFRQIFVDEFQDTDVVQYDIVRALCDPIDGQTIEPSVLFAVGDPKQSIYSFREAEPALFDELINDNQAGGNVVALTTNFRTQSPLTEWINQVVGARFATDGADLQTSYTDLVAVRPLIPGGPAVSLLGTDVDKDVTRSAADVGRAEAADIVQVIRNAVGHADDANPWQVADKPDLPGRDARFGDIAILIRTRTALAAIEDALQLSGIPYRVEGGTLMYERREVYELLRVLRALEDSDDAHAVVSALRTNVFGLSDIDLYEFHRAYRYWNVPSRTAQEQLNPHLDSAGVRRVIAALEQIRGWSDRQHVLGPAQLLAEIYDSMLGAAAAAYADGDAATESWRRVRFVIDEARQWSDATAGTIGEYLRWVADRVDANDRTDISTDELDDAVRILTIHASKGLEYPIVIAAGLGRQDPTPALNTVAVRNGRPEVKIGTVRTLYSGSTDDKLLEQAEEARLLYVAFTRAKDHLIVSVHHARAGNAASRLSTAVDGQWFGAFEWPAADANADDTDVRDSALRALLEQLDLIERSADGAVDDLPTLELPGIFSRQVFTPSGIAALVEGRGGATIDAEADDFEPLLTADGVAGIELDWPTDVSNGPAAVVANTDREATDPGNRKDPASGMIQERSRGRYGTSIGIAVHEALQHVPLTDVDLNDPDTVSNIRLRVEHACARADVADVEPVQGLVESILRSPRWAALVGAARQRREIYVGADIGNPADPLVIWGYIDAVYERPDGSLVLVDFKTDSANVNSTTLAERYRYQMSAYAAALERSTGRRLHEVVLLVGRRDGSAAAEVIIDVLTADQLVAVLRQTDLSAPHPVGSIGSTG